MRIAIGIDIGATDTKYGILTEAGKILEKYVIPTTQGKDPYKLLQPIADQVVRIKEQYNGSDYSLSGVGIGFPGPVLKSGYVEKCVNLQLKGFHATEIMKDLIPGVQVTAGNDANTAALGELWLGGGMGKQNAVFVTLGTGVGSGMILNGQILYGNLGLAGEIGHIVVKPDEVEPCNCGKYGCLNQYACAYGIVRETKKKLELTTQPSVLRGKGSEVLTAEYIMNAAKDGDGLAYSSVEECMALLGKCLADAVYVVDPEVIIIGGGVSKAGDFILPMIEKTFDRHISLSNGRPPIVIARLGNDAGIIGAARMAFLQEKS